MVNLYNCKHSGDQYRITKFTSDFEVEASYLCDLHSCECPAGHRPKCRHREMLPKFIARDAVGTLWFFDFDRGGWVQGWKEEPVNQEQSELEAALDVLYPDFASAALPIQPEPKHQLDIQQYNADENTIKSITERELIRATIPSPSPAIRRRV